MVLRHSAHRGRCLGVLVLLVASCCIGASAIGVNYGTLGNNLPAPAQVVQLIQSTYISKVKIYSTDPTIISAFANTGISLVVGTTNDEISPIASSESFAQQWITNNVAAHYPSTNIICIVVGNEVLTSDPNSSYSLVSAMQNLHTGLTNLGLDDKIKVSTPHSAGVLGTSYPPSDGVFRTDLAGPIISPVLDFLSQTGAPFMINAYPYFAYRDDPQISVAYATFEPNSDVLDSTTGLKYNNLFDAQVDATYAAMAKLGHQDISVTVTESGWPSAGDVNELGVSITNAQTYMSNLLQHVNSKGGTPHKPGLQIDTYMFALFNENQKPGPSSERNFGLFKPDLTEVYNVGLVTKNTNGSSPPVVSTTPPPAAVSPPPPTATPASPQPTVSSSPPPATPPPSSIPPPATTSPPSTSTPPPNVAPPPPYPVPHTPPVGGSDPSPPPSITIAPPPPATASPPPATASPPPATASPPPPTASPPVTASPPPAVTPPPPPSFFTPPPASNSTPPPATVLPSPPPPIAASPPPLTSSPPPSPPAPVAPSPESPPPTTPVTPAPAGGGAPPGTPPAPPGTPSGPNTWCVAKPGSPDNELSTALNYACGEGGADCSQIQSTGACYTPNTLFSHASYAFSSYYALNGRNYWNCFFGNTSLITITNPSYTGCAYP